MLTQQNKWKKVGGKEVPLTPIQIILILQLLHTDGNSITREGDILLLHFRSGIALHVLNDGVGDVENCAQDEQHEEEDEEGVESCHFSFYSLLPVGIWCVL